MIEAIFIVSIVVYLACRQHERRQQQLTYYVPQQRHYIMRETIVHLPNGGQAVHRELEWME